MNDDAGKHVLILGAGSVGRRHMRNLQELGCRISALDPRNDRLEEASETVSIVSSYASLSEIGPAWQSIDAVVVASPPTVHVGQAVEAIERGKAVLLEKPVCAGLDDALRLLAKQRESPGVPVLLGYTYRWWQPLIDFRRKLNEEAVGKPLHAKFVMSAHLADWHPWERYQDFFMASKNLGGGALLDESHFVDLMLWFFGKPASVWSRVEKLSGLEIDTDDNVDIIAVYDSGLRVYIHLDLFGRPHEKYISVAGEGRTLQWSFDPNRYRYSDEMEQNWHEVNYSLERNDMFISLAREFVSILDDPATRPSCSVEDGVEVLEVLEACRESTSTGAMVTLPGRQP